MINIAFCDDDVCVLDRLCEFSNAYRLDRNREIKHTTYRSPLDLLAEIEKGAKFDVVFLDILMPGESGMDAAAEIRNYDKNVKIIFLTGSSEFAAQSYKVGAYFYQLKPIIQEDFFRLMDSAIATCEKEQSNSLILRCKTGITRIELKNIEFCEVIHRTLFIHNIDGTILECTGKLDELCKHLQPYRKYLRIHRSYLVNLEYIQQLTYQAITMSSQTKIPIPRGKFKAIKDAYLEFAFESRQVIL